MPPDIDEWRELRVDRINSATDSGREFTPGWEPSPPRSAGRPVGTAEGEG
ncbi:MAG TPA: hypothetical protein VF134_07920 [Candidatus Dormibacteraeota bacterium]